jgi:hypothetical protein
MAQKNIKLKFLAEDFFEGCYMHSADCPITRALARAGYPHMKDIGAHITKVDYTTYWEGGNYQEMVNIVMRMSPGTFEESINPLPIKSFTYDLVVEEFES